MKNWFKKVISWFKDLVQSGKLRKALDAAITELTELREAVTDFADQIDEYEAQIAKYKKQIEELKANIKALKKEPTEEIEE